MPSVSKITCNLFGLVSLLIHQTAIAYVSRSSLGHNRIFDTFIPHKSFLNGHSRLHAVEESIPGQGSPTTPFVHAQVETNYDECDWNDIKLVDYCKIRVIGGDGGDGCMSFRREKHVPLGGPDGGNGGPGGSVYLQADATVSNLNQVKQFFIYKAGDGSNGLGDGRNGAKGKDRIVQVPCGTHVFSERGELYATLTEHGQRVRVARGGRGAKGNRYYKTQFNVAPKLCDKGEKGTERVLVLDYKIPGNIALVGKPNAGKSSILRRLSSARPRVADFAFCTKYPVHGVLYPPGGEDVNGDSTASLHADFKPCQQDTVTNEDNQGPLMESLDSNEQDAADEPGVEHGALFSFGVEGIDSDDGVEEEQGQQDVDAYNGHDYDYSKEAEWFIDDNNENAPTPRRGLTVVDVPGLIAGASENRGLGHAFLKHVENCSFIAHVLDAGGEDPLDDVRQVSRELELYNPALLDRVKLVIINKIDTVAAQVLDAIKKQISAEFPNLEQVCISAKTGEFVQDLHKLLLQRCNDGNLTNLTSLEHVPKVDVEALDDFTRLNPRKFKVVKQQDGHYVVKSPFLQRKVTMMKFEYPETMQRLRRILKTNRIDVKLANLGAQPGDVLQIGNVKFQIGQGLV